MAKGPEITDEVKILAAQLHEEHPKWTNKEIRNWIVNVVHDPKTGDPSLPKNWPSKYAIDRIMPDIREKVRQRKLNPSPLDMPWSLEALKDNPIPPEALPKVFKLWLMDEMNPMVSCLTVREAKWVSQLSGMTTNNLALLWGVAKCCARYEEIGELTDSSSLSNPLIMFDLLAGLADIPKDKRSEFTGGIAKKHPNLREFIRIQNREKEKLLISPEELMSLFAHPLTKEDIKKRAQHERQENSQEDLQEQLQEHLPKGKERKVKHERKHNKKRTK